MSKFKAASGNIAAVRRTKHKQEVAVARRAEKERRDWLYDKVEPTSQRIAKGDLKKEVIEGGLRHRRFAGVLLEWKGTWPSGTREALEKLLDDSSSADVHGVVARYDGSLSNAPGPRDGGVLSSKRNEFNRFQYVMDALHVEGRKVVLDLILQIPREHGHLVTPEDFGREMIGKGAKKASGKECWRVAMQLVHSVGAQVADAQSKFERLNRR